MNANERFEYMAEQFYKKTGMLAPGKDDPLPRSDEEKHKAAVEWGVFAENFYSNLFQTHADMYEMLAGVKTLIGWGYSASEAMEEMQKMTSEIDGLLKRARGE